MALPPSAFFAGWYVQPYRGGLPEGAGLHRARAADRRAPLRRTVVRWSQLRSLALREVLQTETPYDGHKQRSCETQNDASDDNKTALERAPSDAESAAVEPMDGAATTAIAISAFEVGTAELDRDAAGAVAQRERGHLDYKEPCPSDNAATEYCAESAVGAARDGIATTAVEIFALEADVAARRWTAWRRRRQRGASRGIRRTIRSCSRRRLLIQSSWSALPPRRGSSSRRTASLSAWPALRLRRLRRKALRALASWTSCGSHSRLSGTSRPSRRRPGTHRRRCPGSSVA
mmetsp:Transcript_27701/g.86172  ORF Transcript_27701/g.86172 Transcript_27701/m.86172 type:complete len:290 (+) Transcript_27701:63-932(+)